MSEHAPLPGNTANGGASSRTPSARRPGPHRFALRIGVLLASLGCAWVATSQGRPDFLTTRFGFPAVTGEGKTAESNIPGGNIPKGNIPAERTVAEMANLAGFQRRGNTLVGEVRTREGATMRLVFDARTHTLIGLRVLETAEPAAREPERVRGCVNHSSTAPLPGDATPAN